MWTQALCSAGSEALTGVGGSGVAAAIPASARDSPREVCLVTSPPLAQVLHLENYFNSYHPPPARILGCCGR